MDCKNKDNNLSCNKCIYNLLSTGFMLSKDITKIAKIATNIVWMQDFSIDDIPMNNIQGIFIMCNDNINIVRYKKGSTNSSISIAKHIYCKLLNNWYNFHPDNKQTETYKYVQAKLISVSEYTSITKLRTTAIHIKKYLESMTVCNGFCNTVTPGKEVGDCKIPLSDINKIVKFTSTGLADTLDTIFYTIKDIAIFNLSIDLDNTYVTCSGNVIMDKDYVKCKSTIADMKGIYIYYLSAWCSANIIKESEVRKIRKNIEKVNSKKRMHEMYDLSSDLLDVLS